MTALYVVWRRSDGYVSCSKTRTHGWKPTAEFDVLLITADWAEARAAVEANRDGRHRALVARWDAEAARFQSSAAQ